MKTTQLTAANPNSRHRAEGWKHHLLGGALIQALGLAHGALDVQSPDILPVLLKQRHQEVNSQVDVVHKLVVCHLHVANSHRQTQDLGRGNRGVSGRGVGPTSAVNSAHPCEAGLPPPSPTFFIWNLIVDFTSSTLATMFSLCVSREGNLPALLRPGPRIRGICLIRDSEARKASYFLAASKQHCPVRTWPFLPVQGLGLFVLY